MKLKKKFPCYKSYFLNNVDIDVNNIDIKDFLQQKNYKYLMG